MLDLTIRPLPARAAPGAVRPFLTRDAEHRPMTAGLLVEVARDQLTAETATVFAGLAATTEAEVHGKVALIASDGGPPLVAVFQHSGAAMTAAWCGNALAAASALVGPQVLAIGPQQRIVSVTTTLDEPGIRQDWRIGWAPSPVEIALPHGGRVWFSHVLNDYAIIVGDVVGGAEFVPSGNAKAILLTSGRSSRRQATFALATGTRQDAPLTGLIELAAARAASPRLRAYLGVDAVDLQGRAGVALPEIVAEGAGMLASARLGREVEIGALR